MLGMIGKGNHWEHEERVILRIEEVCVLLNTLVHHHQIFILNFFLMLPLSYLGINVLILMVLEFDLNLV